MSQDNDPGSQGGSIYWPTATHCSGYQPGTSTNLPSPTHLPSHDITLSFTLNEWADIASALEELRHPVHGHSYRLRVMRGILGTPDKLIMEKKLPAPATPTSADTGVDFSMITRSIVGR